MCAGNLGKNEKKRIEQRSEIPCRTGKFGACRYAAGGEKRRYAQHAVRRMYAPPRKSKKICFRADGELKNNLKFITFEREK
jgi:hypothetical protein